MGAFEMIPFITGAGFIEQHRPRQGRLRHNRIGAGLVQSYRIKGCKHAHIWHQGHIVLAVAVTVRRHIDDQRDVETGTAIYNCLAILSHLFVEDSGSRIVPSGNSVFRADGQAPATSRALVDINIRLALLSNWGAPWAQIIAQARQPTHFSRFTTGLPELCISIFPAREPQPMPIFFSVPPMPACS